MPTSEHSGGAAMAGGQRFQAQVTAWWCARVLLQTQMGTTFGFNMDSVPTQIYAETNDQVDDLRVEFSAKERLYGQCKRSLSLSRNLDSEWGSVVKQFYKEQKDMAPGAQYCLVLYYEKNNNHLKLLEQILCRYRKSPAGVSISNSAKSKLEQDILSELVILLNSFAQIVDGDQSSPKLEQLLKHMYIKQLQIGEDGAAYLAVVDALQSSLLSNPTQVTSVLRSLHCLSDDLLAERGSIDRIALRNRLLSEGVSLQESVNYKRDFEILDELTKTEIYDQTEVGRASLSIGNNTIHISRPILDEMIRALEEASFIVTGNAGSGKTGCLLALAEELKLTGYRVWYWAADSLPFTSVHELQTNMGLQNSLSGVFSEAASTSNVVLIIDGLDGLRDATTQRGYRKLIGLAKRVGLRVVASVRMFDLRYAIELQALFPTLPDYPISPELTSLDIKANRHIIIPDLNQKEFGEVLGKLPIIKKILESARNLQPIMYNLFNLDLLCRLISLEGSAIEVTALSTQAELFDRYWQRRVDAQPLRQEITLAISNIVEKMVDQRSLQVRPHHLATDVSNALFSSDFIRHPLVPSGRLVDEQLVEFNHHLLFDYVAERLFIRPKYKNLSSALAAENTWALFLRPSLLLAHRFAWTHGRDDFWETLISLERSPVQLLNKYPGYIVVAEEAKNLADLQPIIDNVVSHSSDSAKWLMIVNQVISAAAFTSLPRLFDKNSGDWWIHFAKNLVDTGNSDLIFAGKRILFTVFDKINTVSTSGKLLANKASISLVNFHWQQQIKSPNPSISAPIFWVCTTFATNMAESTKIIKRIISPTELERAGYMQTYGIARGIEQIIEADPNLVVEIYDAIFGYQEKSREQIQMGSGQILPLLSNKRQDYEMVWYQLSQNYSKFLAFAPREATKALIKVMDHYLMDTNLDLKISKAAFPITEFKWEGSTCRIRKDYYGTLGVRNSSETQLIILETWEKHLEKLTSDKTWESIKEVLITENTSGAIWAKMLLAAASNPDFFAQKIWKIFLDSNFIVSLPLSVIKNTFTAFLPYLSADSISDIGNSILALLNQVPTNTNKNTRLQSDIGELLSCIPDEKRTVLVRDFLKENPVVIRQTSEREPLFGVSKEWWLNSQGIDTNNPAIKEILDASDFLENLKSKSIGETEGLDIKKRLDAIEQKLANTIEVVGNQTASLVQSRLIHGYSQLACSSCALDTAAIDDLVARFRTIMTKGNYSSPTVVTKWMEFNSHDLVNARSDAAGGLVCLATKLSDLTTDYKDVLCSFRTDPDREVRLQVSLRLWQLFKIWPTFVWEALELWIDEIPSNPKNAEILQLALIDNWYWILRKSDSARAKQLMERLVDVANSSISKDLRQICGSWLGAIGFSSDERWASVILNEKAQQIDNNLEELQGALDFAISELLPREIKPNLSINQTAKDFVLNLIGVCKAWTNLHKSELDSNRHFEIEEKFKKIHWLLFRISIEFSVSAENYSKYWLLQTDDKINHQVLNWWTNAEMLLEPLLTVSDPQIAYRLIEGIESIILFDVSRGLHWLNKVTVAAVPYGLSVEQLACDKTIELLGRILAENKSVLSSDESLRDFIQILEAYLQTGWPKAISLAIQLESIFR